MANDLFSLEGRVALVTGASRPERQPRLRMIYVTSMPIDPRIVEYYLALLPGVIPSHALARLSLMSVGDASIQPLSAPISSSRSDGPCIRPVMTSRTSVPKSAMSPLQ